jgi:hypothetical protein
LAVDTIEVDEHDGQDCGELAAFALDAARLSLRPEFATDHLKMRI